MPRVKLFYIGSDFEPYPKLTRFGFLFSVEDFKQLQHCAKSEFMSARDETMQQPKFLLFYIDEDGDRIRVAS